MGLSQIILTIALSLACRENMESWNNFAERHQWGQFCHLWGFPQVLEKV